MHRVANDGWREPNEPNGSLLWDRILSKHLKRHLKSPALWRWAAKAKPDRAKQQSSLFCYMWQYIQFKEVEVFNFYCREDNRNIIADDTFLPWFHHRNSPGFVFVAGDESSLIQEFSFRFLSCFISFTSLQPPVRINRSESVRTISKNKIKKKAEELLLTFICRVRCKTLQIQIKPV